MDEFKITEAIFSPYVFNNAVLSQDLHFRYYKYTGNDDEVLILARHKETKQIYKVHIPTDIDKCKITWIALCESRLYLILNDMEIIIFVYKNLKLLTKIIPKINNSLGRKFIIRHNNFLYIMNYYKKIYHLIVLNINSGIIVNENTFKYHKRIWAIFTLYSSLCYCVYEPDYFYIDFCDKKSIKIQYTIGNGYIMDYSNTNIKENKYDELIIDY